ncbi:DEAD/DEAH box helicase family protein [Streptomyces sp. 3211]|uniref:DEAD/DEAH box helicase family protein n=1 Tax=Streptomyces sp. 3211 TaxID=1964449 RepID=UPI0009A4B7C4|nr:DEAD/DEAH box helicase family protein [Streptomyces sp. 3211]
MTRERRRFNSSERVALFLTGAGVCAGCGVELEPGWHADHQEPWSAGGATDVMNGQALCPPCNLTKGNRHVKLRRWQEDGMRAFVASRKDFLAVATPGAGKTTFGLLAYQSLVELGEARRLVVVAPTSHLRKQWAKAAAKVGIQLDADFANRDGVSARDYDGVVTTYQSVAASPLTWERIACNKTFPTLVILDEVHHAGDAETLSWGTALETAFAGAQRRLLLSGTPFRTDQRPIPFVQYDVTRRAVPDINYDYGAALQDREVVRPVAFPAMDGEARWRFASDEKLNAQRLSETDSNTHAAALKAALDPAGNWIPSVLQRANDELALMREDVPDMGGLVVARDQAAAQAYAEILRQGTGEPVSVAISDDPAASKVIDRYAEGTSRWIVAVQMVSEGVDIPRLGVVVYASNVRTEMFFRQVVGRCVRKRGPEDETCARVFVPSITPILRMAADIEKTVDAVLADEEQRIQRDQGEDGGEGTTRKPSSVEVLGSSVAVHPFTIASGNAFADAELQRARQVMREAGIPMSVEASAFARALRLAGAFPEQKTEEPAETRPLVEEKAEIRNLVQRKVGQLSKITRRPHGHIHADLNRECGEASIKVATVPSLKQRLVYLDRWLKDTRR